MTTALVKALQDGTIAPDTDLAPQAAMTTDELGAYAQKLGNAQFALMKARRKVDLAYVGRLIAEQHPEIESVEFWIEESTDYDGAYVPAEVHGTTHQGALVEDIRLFVLLNNNLSESTLRDLHEDHWYSADADGADLLDGFVLNVAATADQFTAKA